MGEKTIKITQSLMKSLYEVRQGDECGLVLKAKFIDNRFDLFPPSDSMNIGTWFEYTATGSVPKSGKIPEPERLKTKDEKGNYRLESKYAKAFKQVENYKRLLMYYNLEILSVGEDIEFDGLKGTLDIKARAKTDIYQDGELIAKAGQIIIIDMKMSGLLDDRWNPYGWELSTLNEKQKIVLQPIHYLFIAKNIWEGDTLFWFFLFSNTNDYDHRIIDFRVTEQDFENHLDLIAKSIGLLKHYLDKGFPPAPDYLRCMDCPLKLNCKHFVSVPKIQIHHYINS